MKNIRLIQVIVGASFVLLATSSIAGFTCKQLTGGEYKNIKFCTATATSSANCKSIANDASSTSTAGNILYDKYNNSCSFTLGA